MKFLFWSLVSICVHSIFRWQPVCSICRIVSVAEMCCQICALSRFTSRFSEDSVALTEEQTSIWTQISRFIRAAERKLLECRRRHRRAVVRAQLRLWFSVGSGQWTFQECRSRTTQTRIGYGYRGLMCYDAREVWSHRARESRERIDERIARKGQRFLCAGWCIWDT